MPGNVKLAVGHTHPPLRGGQHVWFRFSHYSVGDKTPVRGNLNLSEQDIMIRSMTGYAVMSREYQFGMLNMELRSVNHRYLDLQFRLGDELRSLESLMREAIGRRLTRGKVDCRLHMVPHDNGGGPIHVDTVLIRQLAELNQQVKEFFPASHDLAVGDVLRWPGVIAQQSISPERLQTATITLLDDALDELCATREREGEKLKVLLLDRIAQAEMYANQVYPLVPQLQQAFRDKLIAALKEAGADVDNERIRQEVTLFAQRVDVDEELSRLQTHLDEARRVLQQGGVAGKRLDFLMQELHREANTLGAKSAIAETSRLAMELKILVEQMREQIQNIE